MDLNDDENSLIFRRHSRIATCYFEPNAGHMFVNNVNPFDTFVEYRAVPKENRMRKPKNDEFINLYDNTRNQNTHKRPPNALVNKIIKHYPHSREMFMNESTNEIRGGFLSNRRPTMNTNRPFSQPTINMSNNRFDDQFLSSSSQGPNHSRHDQQVRFEEYEDFHSNHTNINYAPDEMMTDHLVDDNENGKAGKAEKTTYCRPSLNLYNQEFVYKTMQRNARLQKLVRKLIAVRETEKQREHWNNYINDLKNKHRYYSNEPTRISPQYVPEEHNQHDELIDDFYNTRFNCQQSNPCQHLLHDFYEAHPHIPPEEYDRYINDCESTSPLNVRPYLYETNRHCYPTSSQANLILRNKERQENNYARERRDKSPGKSYRGNTILVDKEHKQMQKKQGPSRITHKCSQSTSKSTYKNKMSSMNRNLSVPIQTDCTLPLVNEESDSDEETHHKHENFKDKIKKVSENIARLKNKLCKTEEQIPKPKKEPSNQDTSLALIGEKIDTLIMSINTVMLDIKSKKINSDNKTASVSCKLFTNSHNDLNRPKSDPYGINRNEEYICNMARDSKNYTFSDVGPSSFIRDRESNITKMDKILLEEMKKSNKVKRDIEELLNLHKERNCAVQITFEIPTKERSTEVTDSLAKTRLDSGTKVVVEEISTDESVEERPIQTIAVNTDPLGLLALLRVSAETLKQLLSYVPNLNYNSYFSMLPLPSGRTVSHYICNICGAAFGRPSQLSDHIEQHNLGRTRDCCVCRHVLDMRSNRVGLFTCRYCGQNFTRAYCCELHEQSCARHRGTRHDINSGHALLRYCKMDLDKTIMMRCRAKGYF